MKTTELDAHEIELIQQKLSKIIDARGIDRVEAIIKAQLAYIAMVRTMQGALGRLSDTRPYGWDSV